MNNLTGIHTWYQTEAGELIAQAIEQHVWQMTACIFGYVAVQVGTVFHHEDLLKNCTIGQKIILDQAQSPNIFANPTALPFTHDSVDLFILPHTLDFINDPHQVLREVERSLVPEGYLLIIGFNPYSFFGLWRFLLSRKKVAPWSANFYSVRRMHDWSSLLGFDTVEVRHTANLPPFKKLQRWRKMQSMDNFLQKRFSRFGGVYLFLARKRVATLTPLTTKVWAPSDRLIGGKIIKPSVGMRESGGAS